MKIIHQGSKYYETTNHDSDSRTWLRFTWQLSKDAKPNIFMHDNSDSNNHYVMHISKSELTALQDDSIMNAHQTEPPTSVAVILNDRELELLNNDPFKFWNHIITKKGEDK